MLHCNTTLQVFVPSGSVVIQCVTRTGRSVYVIPNGSCDLSYQSKLPDGSTPHKQQQPHKPYESHSRTTQEPQDQPFVLLVRALHLRRFFWLPMLLRTRFFLFDDAVAETSPSAPTAGSAGAFFFFDLDDLGFAGTLSGSKML